MSLRQNIVAAQYFDVNVSFSLLQTGENQYQYPFRAVTHLISKNFVHPGLCVVRAKLEIAPVELSGPWLEARKEAFQLV